MAYRKSNGKLSRRSKKRQPAVLQMNFILPAGESYIDLALAASIVNRRGYKQQDMTWGVAQFELFAGANSSGVVEVQKLPETWVYENAYKKTKALWTKMNDQVLDQEEGIQGTYSDFKIAMDADQVSATIQDNGNPTGTILTPVQVVAGANQWTLANFQGAGPAPLADWNYSQVTIPNDPAGGTTTSYYLHAVGPDTVGSKGLIAGYAQSRARPTSPDPNVPTVGGWMTELFDDGEQLDDLRDIIQDDNDRVPYANGGLASSLNWYPGGTQEQPELQTHSFCNFTTTTVSKKNVIMGGLFQNGLMKFNNFSGDVVSLVLHLMPGSHRGYFCEEM